jgi:hypothetical protein
LLKQSKCLLRTIPPRNVIGFFCRFPGLLDQEHNVMGHRAGWGPVYRAEDYRGSSFEVVFRLVNGPIVEAGAFTGGFQLPQCKIECDRTRV